jgi:hypothetical protein
LQIFSAASSDLIFSDESKKLKKEEYGKAYQVLMRTEGRCLPPSKALDCCLEEEP